MDLIDRKKLIEEFEKVDKNTLNVPWLLKDIIHIINEQEKIEPKAEEQSMNEKR